jgi:hypothetical protein
LNETWPNESLGVPKSACKVLGQKFFFFVTSGGHQSPTSGPIFGKLKKKAEKSEKNQGDREFYADHFPLTGHPSIYHRLTSRGHQSPGNLIKNRPKHLSQIQPQNLQKVSSGCITWYRGLKQCTQQCYSWLKLLVTKM